MARHLHLLVLLTLLAAAASSLHAASSTPPAGAPTAPVSRRLGPVHDLQHPVAPDDDAVSASPLPAASPAHAAPPSRDAPGTDATPAVDDASHPHPTDITGAGSRAVYDVTVVFRATRRLGPPRLRYSIVPAGADDDTNGNAAPDDDKAMSYLSSLLILGAALFALGAVVGWLAPRPHQAESQPVRVRVRVTLLHRRRLPQHEPPSSATAAAATVI